MGLNRSRAAPKGSGREYAVWKATQHAEVRARIERRIGLSELAKATRRPGQTLQDRTRELENER
jgi:hypothetical protein